MSIVSLELFKKHVRADDFSEDDAYLSHLLEASEAYVATLTNRSLCELLEMGGERFPREVEQAVLLLGGHWYNQREGVGNGSLTEVPFTISALLTPFTRLV